MTDDDSDAMLDRLDRGEPAASPEEAEAREPYERLISQIRELPNEAPPDGWESRLKQRWRRQTGGAKRRRRWLAPGVIGALVAAAAVLGIVVYCRPTSGIEPGGSSGTKTVASFELIRNKKVVDRGDGMVGDSLRGDGLRTRTVTSVRIYRDMILVATCPGDANCSATDKTVVIDVVATEPGYYRMMVINGDREPPAASKGFELDRGELMRAGFSVEIEPLGRRVKM